MDDTFQQFRAKLDDLFQMDRAELDFGIYRIMNIKRGEISRYLDEDLYPQVEEILAEAASDEAKAIQEELEKKIAQAKELGVDPESLDAVKDLRTRLAATTSSEELRQRTFSHLLTFFSRYYDKGDFISKRRYKDGTYMIPYNGEEVKLVWANMDQYYIKTSEYLRDYRFFLNPEKTLRTTFKLVEGDTERDNIKGKNRIFQLRSEEPVTVTDEGLVAYFEYLLSDSNQKDANARAYTTILEQSDRYRPYLEQKDEKSGKTLLEKHLAGYTARNSEDYFIHKDLNGFLERELDFFLKNEVLRIDDMIGNNAEGMQAELHLARAIKAVGGKIIAMLAQIEEFQKKLWLKRKMVASTNYLVTLDKIIEKAPELLSEIAANEAQREEWVRLFAIDEIGADSGSLPGMGGVAYSEPLTEDFLRANDKLVVDTRFFDRDFVATLLAGFDDIDKETDGLLVHSENFQVLNLLQERYREKVKCIYIDPPYNTSGSEIAYKNGYRHSSWLSLMDNRIQRACGFMANDAILTVAIDDAESNKLVELLDASMGEENRLAVVPVRSKPQGRAVPSGFSPNHEYALFYQRTSMAEVGRLPRDEKKMERYRERDPEGFFAWANFRGTGANSWRENRPKLFYPVFITREWKPVIPDFNWNETDQEWVPVTVPSHEKRLLPIDEDGTERVWTMGWQRAREELGTTVVARQVHGTWQLFRKYRPNQDGVLPGTWWDSPKYSASESGTKVVRSQIGESQLFSYPKSISTVEDSLRASNSHKASVILDFFAGSGTTGHAVINLNREDSGSRKYILVEMGEYFDTVLKPRIAKVIYSTDWKDGRPQSRNTGVSQLVKYIRLESYEDTLNNLTVPEQGEYSTLLEQGVDREFRQGYLLGYMLDWEAGAARMTTERFAHPFDSILNVAGDTVGERRPVTVDLVETFNYLIGLTVKSYYEVEGCRIVEGYDPAGDHVLIVWRDLDATGNDALNELFLKQRINIRDREFDLIYVNGDNNLENIRREDESWKVRLIEHEFTARMFAESI